MRHAAWALLLAMAAMGLWSLEGDRASRELAVATRAGAAEAPKKSGGLPPLVVDRDSPLLLDEPAKKPSSEPADGPVADNSACYVCHTNYEEEPMVVVHARKDVGCMDCLPCVSVS